MDHSIIQQLRNGNERARNVFYKQYRTKLYHYCYHLVGNHSDAEDTVHETFIRIFNGIDNLHSSAAFRSWVYTIARNESLQLIRKKRPVTLADRVEIPENESIEQQIESDDITRIVKSEIYALKPKYREIILLREYHHLSYEEIADVLKTNESTVKARLFRARKKLFEKLSPYFDER